MRSFFKKRKYFHVAFVLISMIILSTGCGFKDIDKRIFVIGVGVDKGENHEKPYRVTLKLAIPSGGAKNSPKPQYTYLTREAKTITDAVRILKSDIDKELEFGHAKVLILGENIIDRDIRVVADFFFRRRDIQQISWVAVGKPSAEAVLKAEPSAETSGANVLFNIFSGVGAESSYIVSTNLYDFRRRLTESGIDAVLPILETNKKKKDLKIHEAVVFKNKKKKLYLDADQTQEFNVLAGDLNTINFDVEVAKDDLQFSVFVDKVDMKYEILSEDATIKMKVKMTGIIQESKTRLSPSQLNRYNKLASEEAKKRLLKFLKLMQKEGVDPLGFGLRYEATHLHTHDIAAEWEKLYPKLKFDVSVDTSIKDTGTIN